jgi:predicted transcriptional regulator
MTHKELRARVQQLPPRQQELMGILVQHTTPGQTLTRRDIDRAIGNTYRNVSDYYIHLPALQQRGLILIEQTGGRGRQPSYHYRLHPDVERLRR